MATVVFIILGTFVYLLRGSIRKLSGEDILATFYIVNYLGFNFWWFTRCCIHLTEAVEMWN